MLTTVIKIYHQLSRIERLGFWLTIAARAALVSLDLVGVALTGVTFSILTATATTSESATGRFLSFLQLLGLPKTFQFVSILAITFFILKAVLSIGLNRLMENHLSRLSAKKAGGLFEVLIHSQYEKLTNWDSKRTSRALLESMNKAFGNAIAAVSIIFGELFLIATVAIFLAIVHFPMFLATTAYFAILGTILYFTMAKRVQTAAATLEANTIQANTLVENVLMNFRQISTSLSRSEFVEKFAGIRQTFARASAALVTSAVVSRYITEVAVMLGIGFIFIGKSVLPSEVLPTSVIAIFLAAAFRIVASMLPLNGSLNSLKEIQESSALALSLISELSFISDESEEFEVNNEESEPIESAVGIRFKDVCYSYPKSGELVFENLNLEIPAGIRVAVIGRSGVGKSTLADLALSMRTPISGSLTYFDSRNHIVKSKAVRMSYVPQETSLIAATLRQNITLSFSSSLRDDWLERVVENCDLSELVKSLPFGFDTKLDNSGSSLSGGQIQRIGIARALYQRPNLLVLDEATSALDSISATWIERTLHEVVGDCTLISIAHKMETLKTADKILLLEKGRNPELKSRSQVSDWHDLQDALSDSK